MKECHKLLLEQLEIMEQMVKNLKDINRIYKATIDYHKLDLSKIENDIIEVIENIEKEAEDE